MVRRSSVPSRARINGPGMSGSRPDSANAAIVIGERFGPLSHQRLCVASSLTVRTPLFRTPARAVLAFGRTAGVVDAGTAAATAAADARVTRAVRVVR